MEYIVMRHFEESWEGVNPKSEYNLPQFKKVTAAIMGLAEKGIPLLGVAHSGVSRAHQTAMAVCREVKYQGQVQRDPALYEDSISHWFQPDSKKGGLLLIVSHEPAILGSGFGRLSCGEAVHISFNRMRQKIKRI